MKEGKYGILYNDPRLQLERFSVFENSLKRMNELEKTAVMNLKFIIIVEEIIEDD